VTDNSGLWKTRDVMFLPSALDVLMLVGQLEALSFHKSVAHFILSDVAHRATVIETPYPRPLRINPQV